MTESTEEAGITRYHIVLFVICLLANVFGGTVSTLMSTYLPVAVKELAGGVGEDLNEVGAYINAFFIFGWAFGGVLCGILGDRIGRARAIALSTGFYGLFTLLTGLTDSWTMVCICRFLSGFGVGGVLVTTPTILSEVWPVRSRTIFIGILSIGIPVGIFSAGAIDLVVANWHQAFYVGLLPIALSLFAAWQLKESEKWITRKAEGAAPGKKPGMGIPAAYRGDLFLGSLIFGSMLVGLWAIFSWLPTWVHLNVSTMPGGSDESVGYSMMIFGAAGLTGGFFSGWLSNVMGARKAMILCFAVCLLFSFLLFKTNPGVTLVFVDIAFIALFFGASQGVLSSYIPGLFPPSIRATATGLCFNIGRLVTGTAVFFVGFLVTILGGYGNAIFTFSLVFIVGLVSTWFSREVDQTPRT